MFFRSRISKHIFRLFVSAIIIAGFWSWYSCRLIPQFNFVRHLNAAQKIPASINSDSKKKPENRSQKHKTSLITTTTCTRSYFLLILVSSAPPNAERRNDIRQTWGVDFAVKPRWKTFFLVARTLIQRELNSLLTLEDEIYRDLVRANYNENYWNQTLKVQMGFEWAVRYCKFSFLLKTDDDVFVNTKALILHLIKPNTPTEKLYMGNYYKSAEVHRIGKWKVSREEYNRSYYPGFCPGFGYVLSADVVALFVDLFDVVPAFRLDDVYIGLLAEKAGVKVIHNDGFIVGPPKVTECILHSNTLVWHGVFGDCLYEVYNQTLREEKILPTVFHHFQIE